jgi:hypothetical protein
VEILDESGANTQMTRRCGRSPVGQRLVCSVPQGHYQTTTMIAAVRLQGLQAPWLFDGLMDGELFLAWVKQGLTPALRRDDVLSIHAQGGRGPGGHRGGWGATGIFAAVFAGLQSH